MTVEGIDISVYQSSTPSLAGREFVFCRATYGTSPDSRYSMHAGNVRSAGKVLGAYHFVLDTQGAAAQVAAFLGTAGGADLLALDLEGGDDSATGRTIARNMIDQLHGQGRKVGLYHSLSGFPDLGQDWDWVAYWYDSPPPRPWDFWQYRGSPLDLDRWRGDLASLRAFAAGGPAEGPSMIYERQAKTGKAVAPSGATVAGYRLGATDWERVKTATGPATWHVDHVLHKLSSGDGITYALHMADGPLLGLYVNSAAVTETYDPAPPAPSPADLAAAKAAGYADAKAKAIGAVQSI